MSDEITMKELANKAFDQTKATFYQSLVEICCKAMSTNAGKTAKNELLYRRILKARPDLDPLTLEKVVNGLDTTLEIASGYVAQREIALLMQSGALCLQPQPDEPVVENN